MNTIPKGKYEGWLWKSDAREPEIITPDTEQVFSFDDNKNPFVIEGQLWDAQTRTSYSIRYVDGRHIVKKFDVEESDLDCNEHATKKSFIAHRLGKHQCVNMLQYWKEVPDDLCCGFPMLQPDKLVFVGFGK